MIIIVHKCSADNLPSGVQINVMDFACGIKIALGKMAGNFDPLYNTYSGDGTKTSKAAIFLGNDADFIEYSELRLDKTLNMGKDVLVDVSIGCSI